MNSTNKSVLHSIETESATVTENFSPREDLRTRMLGAGAEARSLFGRDFDSAVDVTQIELPKFLIRESTRAQILKDAPQTVPAIHFKKVLLTMSAFLAVGALIAATVKFEHSLSTLISSTRPLK